MRFLAVTFVLISGGAGNMGVKVGRDAYGLKLVGFGLEPDLP